MQLTFIALVLLAAQPETREVAARANHAPDPTAATIEVASDELATGEVEMLAEGGYEWPLIIHKRNPNHTLGMVRYVERGGYLYARPYDYRTLLDYPWHHRKPLHPPYPTAVSTPYEVIPVPTPRSIEEVPAPQAAARRYPDVEVAPLDTPRSARPEQSREARLRRLIAPLGRPADHLVR